MKVIKRDGKSVDYDREKIRKAIGKANVCVSEKDRIKTAYVKGVVKTTTCKNCSNFT